jgi:predicted phosphodiesterase
MRVFALSDLHLDYEENKTWLMGLSNEDFQSDWLILAGDISDDVRLTEACFAALTRKFSKIFFVPGNHDLWVRQDKGLSSLEKFHLLLRLADEHGILTEIYREDGLTIVPLLGWYDYSYGLPGEQLLQSWLDYHACRWPNAMTPGQVTEYFLRLNREAFRWFGEKPDSVFQVSPFENDVVISFSHFVPRLDVMPPSIPQRFHYIYPVLGSSALDQQNRQWQAHHRVHVYGHSHVNRSVIIDDIYYVNNAFGYPSEQLICRKALFCIHGDGAGKHL